MVKAVRIAESAEKIFDNRMGAETMTMIVRQDKEVKIDSRTPKTELTPAEYKLRYAAPKQNNGGLRESRLDFAHTEQVRNVSARSNSRSCGYSWRTPRPAAGGTPSPFLVVSRSFGTNQQQVRSSMQISRKNAQRYGPRRNTATRLHE